ncbi:MAG: type II secretion system protein [Betaproteobacteria bacterium]|nr:type II secretion system protein [Betaproteobacteria bacterium]
MAEAMRTSDTFSTAHCRHAVGPVFANQRGFTLMAVLFIIFSMGIGLGVASENWRTASIRDRERELIWVGRAYRDAIRGYVQTYHLYPPSIDALLQDPQSPVPKRFLRKIYPDPVTGKNEWALITVNDRIVGIRSLSEKEALKSDNFDLGEAGFAKKSTYAEWVFTHPADLKIANAKIRLFSAEAVIDASGHQ